MAKFRKTQRGESHTLFRGVEEFTALHYTFELCYKPEGHGFDSTTNEKLYQEYFLRGGGVKAAGA